MAAPVVAGTVALMLQANPNLTPNLVKAILQYTAQPYRGLQRAAAGRRLPEHARRGRLAQFYAGNTAGSTHAGAGEWSQQIIWGNHRISRRLPQPARQRLGDQHRLGRSQSDDDGDNIVWGTPAAR